MPRKPTYPVRLVLELADQDEHLRWYRLARAEGLDLDAWITRAIRALIRDRAR